MDVQSNAVHRLPTTSENLTVTFPHVISVAFHVTLDLNNHDSGSCGDGLSGGRGKGCGLHSCLK